nr:hypothetical protein [Nostoc sp. ChiQUE02]
MAEFFTDRCNTPYFVDAEYMLCSLPSKWKLPNFWLNAKKAIAPDQYI